jgi:membrane dipeptidase
MIQLSSADEERAQRLHRDSLIMVCHDHNLFPEDMEAMRRGGVTAKQVHICLDGLIWADREAFRASAKLEDGYIRRALVAMDYIYWQIENSQGRVVLALEPEDIVRAKEQGAVALLLGSEGSRLVEGRLEVLRMLHRLGLRHVQLSWAWETVVGAPQSDRSGRGLTDFGRDLIREMNRLGMIVDVSHLAYQSIYDSLEVSATPLLNSHTGAAALNPEQPQLLPDDLIRAMADKGGVVALHFMSQMVKPGRRKATFGELMAQFEYVAELVGTDHIACGPDYLYLDPRLWENQGISIPFEFAEGVEDISQMLNVTRGLVARGFSDEDIRKMMGGNLLRLFQTARDAAKPGPWPYKPYAEGIGASTDGATPL